MLVGPAVTDADRALATVAAVIVTDALNVPVERAKDAFEPLVALRGGALTALYVHLREACAVAVAASRAQEYGDYGDNYQDSVEGDGDGLYANYAEKQQDKADGAAG